jgi:hypothetical protein
MILNTIVFLLMRDNSFQKTKESIMGWLNTILDVANLGMNVAQLGQLDTMRRQGAEAALIHALLQDLRNQIFNYRQAAQSILDYKEKDQKAAAGAMRVLELRLQDSGITADLFPDLDDKEYVAQTYKFIRDNGRQMTEQLSADEIGELETMSKAADRYPEYNYYIDNYDDFVNLEKANEELKKHKFFSGKIAANGLGCASLLVFGFLTALFIQWFNNITMGFILGFLITLVGALWISRYIRRAREAQKTIKELDPKLDVDMMRRLDRELGDLQNAHRLRNEAKMTIMRFFGDSPLLPI